MRRYLYWLVSKKNPAPTREGGRPTNTVRDFMLVSMVARISQHRGIKPTRQRDSRKDRPRSGCDIVAQVLGELGVINLSERAVEKIWEELRSDAQPDCLPFVPGLTPD